MDKRQFTEEHRQKLSLAHKGQHSSPATEFKKGHKKCYKTGRQKHSGGYILLYLPKHPYAGKVGKSVLEHRVIMEKHIGRYLKPTEVVHHINGTRDDNRIDNLMLFPSTKAHTEFHRSILSTKVSA